MPRLSAACREVRNMVESSPPRAAAVRALVGTRTVQAGARVSFIAANRDDDTRRLDAVAGGEFLDDRIRLRE
jgi:hypothetical protein